MTGGHAWEAVMHRSLTLVGCVVSVVALAMPALAVDGVIEFNQAAVLAGGISPGDAPGFPATLSAPGSYRLTGNLDVTAEPSPENVTAVVISVGDVTLDLNGFAIIGPTVCMGDPVTSCSPEGAGAGYGVFASSENSGHVGNIAVLNGSIHGMGHDGVYVHRIVPPRGSARIEGLHLTGNARSGAVCEDDRCSMLRNTSIRNGEFGFFGGSVVAENEARGNRVNGISVFQGTVSQNIARGNGVDGISGDGTFIGNTCVNNARAGIRVFGGNIVNNMISGNTGDGIKTDFNNALPVFAYAAITGNMISGNGGLGISTDAPERVGFGNNVIAGNAGGNGSPQVTAGMITLATNACRLTPVCP